MSCLVARGLVETREQAKRSIMAGIVFSAETRLDKPGEKIRRMHRLIVKGNTLKYVSRGGLKLEKALEQFDVDVNGKIVLISAHQLAVSLIVHFKMGHLIAMHSMSDTISLHGKSRQDPRVTVMERTNFRHATPELFTEGIPKFATIDVSFISLTLILPALKGILRKAATSSPL